MCVLRPHTHTHTYTPPYSQRRAQVAEWLWSAVSPLMIPLAIQVCVGWPACLSQRRPFLSGLCQPGEHHWSSWPPLSVRALPHLRDTPRLQMWELQEKPSLSAGGRKGFVGGAVSSSRWAGAALNANGIIVCSAQVLAVQMRSQLKCGSSEVEEGSNILAESWQAGCKPKRCIQVNRQSDVALSWCLKNSNLNPSFSQKIQQQLYYESSRVRFSHP